MAPESVRARFVDWASNATTESVRASVVDWASNATTGSVRDSIVDWARTAGRYKLLTALDVWCDSTHPLMMTIQSASVEAGIVSAFQLSAQQLCEIYLHYRSANGGQTAGGETQGRPTASTEAAMEAPHERETT
jgi:hypothetical protein